MSAIVTTISSVGPRAPAARPPTALLSFTLPPGLLLGAEPGRYAPCLHGVRLDVGLRGVVTIGGYDGLITRASDAAIEQAMRFLSAIAPRGVAAQVFDAQLVIAGDERAEQLAVAVGARVVIAKSPIASRPALLLAR